MKTDLIFLDTETTGNVVGEDRLCEVCYLKSGDLYTKRFKPPVPISTKAASVTHITNAMVEHEEVFVGSKYARELQAHLETHVLVAHNARFDIAMLQAEGVDVPRHICTLRLARYLDTDDAIPEFGLQFLRYHFGVDVLAQPHSAEGDVVVLKAVFEHLFTMAKERAKDASDEQLIARMIDISAQPSLIRRFSFGKYNGQLVEDVARIDRGYLEWLLRQKREGNEADEEDWIFTLEKCLRS